MPSIEPYNDMTDPIEHIERHYTHMEIEQAPEVILWKTFLTTLTCITKDSYKKLPPWSINIFNELTEAFITNFMSLQEVTSGLSLDNEKKAERISKIFSR